MSDLHIRTKDKQLAPLVPNAVQTLYLDMLQSAHEGFDWRNGIYTLRGVREDILKARQEGMSTLWLALYFLDTINIPLTQTIILAHDTDTTERLFKIVHRFYEHLPPHKKRPKKYSSRREIEFADIDSIIAVGTAGGDAVGRGGTINNVHMSERAFWPGVDGGVELEMGLMEAVPLDGNITRETTANGLNGYYQERQDEERGESIYTPRFFGWNLNPEYRIEPAPDFVRTEEEETLAAGYGIDDAQLAWRRVKRLALKDKFAQEYPINAQEAFLASGNPYFDRSFLFEVLAALNRPEFAPITLDIYRERFQRIWQAHKEGKLLVWEAPAAGREYTIGADTAEGIDESGKADFDSADVIDTSSGVQVAHLHGKWDTREYGLMLAELGTLYNEALLGVERNNHGHAVLNAIIYEADYDNVYYHEEYDEVKKLASRKPGWPTTVRTKFFALDGLATSIVERAIRLRSKLSVSELLTYVKLPGGKAGGDGGSHDDCVSSLAIADALLKQRPAPSAGWIAPVGAVLPPEASSFAPQPSAMLPHLADPPKTLSAVVDQEGHFMPPDEHKPGRPGGFLY